MDSMDAGYAGWRSARLATGWAGSSRLPLSSCWDLSSSAAGRASANVGSAMPPAQIHMIRDRGYRVGGQTQEDQFDCGALEVPP